MLAYLVSALVFFSPAIVAVLWVYVVLPVYLRASHALYEWTQRQGQRVEYARRSK